VHQNNYNLEKQKVQSNNYIGLSKEKNYITKLTQLNKLFLLFRDVILKRQTKYNIKN